MICLAIGVLTGAFVMTPAQAEKPVEIPIHAPELSNRAIFPEVQEDPVLRMAIRNQLTPTARIKTYDRVETHPLILEAADILTDKLRPYATGVYITSFARSPEDQKRLLKERRSRYWATQRSKHLAGLAADIGFVKRRVSTYKMRDLAEATLKRLLTEEKFNLLRIVRESHCIHIEIDTRNGKEIILKRRRELENLGIVEKSPESKKRTHPVPSLDAYISEEDWTETRTFLEPLPY